MEVLCHFETVLGFRNSKDALDKGVECFLECLIFPSVCEGFFTCSFVVQVKRTLKTVVSSVSSMEVVLTCYTGSFEIIFSSP